MTQNIPHSAAGLDNFVSNLPIVFLKELEVNPPDMVRSLFMQKPWNPAEGDRVTFDSFALPSLAERVGENESYPLVGITEGDSMTVNQVQYSTKFDYTVRMDHFDKLQLATRMAAQMVRNLNATLDNEMSHKLFADAEDATYQPRNKNYTVDWTCADDVAYCSTSHTVNGLPGDMKANEYVPVSAEAISPNSLVKLMQTGNDNIVNDDGISADFAADELWIPNEPYMLKRAREILGSNLTPLSANNAVNVFGPNNDWNMKLVVFKKALTAADGKTRRTTDTARFRYAIADSRYREAAQYQIASQPKLRLKDSSNDNALTSILVDMFAAFVTIRWQGVVFHRQNVSQPS